MSYRDDIEALAARHAALESEAAEAARERDHTADMLREVRARAKLPVLDDIRVAAPCKASWDAMTPVDAGGRVRACGDCRKNVYNLSEMTRDDAEALIVAHEGALCVRYYKRGDGTILTKDCSLGVRRRRRRRAIAAGLAVMFGTGAVVTYEARCGTSPATMGNFPTPSRGEATTGAVGPAALTTPAPAPRR